MKILTALTIKSRIIIASTLVFGIALVAFAMVIYHSSRRAEFEKLEARLESHADKLQTEIEEQMQEGVFPNLADLNAIRTEGLPQILRQLYDSTNQVLLDDSLLAKASLLPQPFHHPGEPVLRRISIQGRRYLGYKTPIEIEEHGRFVLLLAVPLGEIDENLARLRWVFYLSIPATLLLAGLAILLIARHALKPLSSMTATAQRISASNLSQRLELPAAHDEVRVFAETLNRMIERLDFAFQSQKQFVSDASHEIRTPLTVLNSELEYARKLVENKEAGACLDASLAEIDRLSHMVEGLLLLTRIDADRPVLSSAPVRLDEIVIETVQSLHWLADRKKITLTPYIQEAVEIPGPGELVRRALVNVIDNAVKYAPSESEVTIRLEISPDRIATIFVEDHGPGISPSDQVHIFERFFRGENARAETDGSGLGLAIARKAVELRGGTITLASTVGQGTTVSIRIPAL